MKKVNLGFCLLMLLLPLEIFSQLTVTPNSVATTLAQTITGSGVTVSSASLNCGGGAAGTFSYSGSNLGMTGGIILTTGAASDAANPGTYFSDVINGNNYSDPDLTAINSDAYNDVCILEFDFIPVCTNVNITFVFGSEEYPNFVGSFNDGFAIFLSGPNPSGGNYSAQNIGVLPSGTAVSINNVNSGSNPTYFHDNYTAPNNDISYGGYTIPVTSITPVTPCSTYHMKIAIADALDEAYDSGVFIGNNAVSCTNAPTVVASSSSASCGASNGSVTATVTNYTGTVTYSWTPGGQTTSSVNNLPAGTYSCVVSYTTACAVMNQTVTTTIANTGAVITVNATPQNVTCASSTNGSASITISGGASPYTAVWNTSPVQTGTTAVNLGAGVYQVTVTDNSGCIQTQTVTVGVTNPTVIQVSSTSVCGTQGVLTAPNGTNYQWYDNSGAIIGGATSQTYSATGVSGGQHYTATYTDPVTGCKDSAQINITQINISFIPATSAPCNGGNNGSLGFTPAAGNNFTSFDWNMTGTSSTGATAVGTPITINNLTGGNYTVVIAQAGNPSCFYTYSVTLVQGVIGAPTIDTIKVCNGDTVSLNPNVAGSSSSWYTSTGASLGSTTPLLLYPAPYAGLNINKNGAAYYDTLQNAAGCKSVYKAVIKFKRFDPSVSILVKPRCFNDSTGKIKVGAVREWNGPINQPYSFTWIYPSPYASPATINSGSSSTPVFSTEANLHPGYYQCIIKAGNCIDTVDATLTNPPPLPNDTMHAFYCPKDSLALIVAPAGYSPYQWYNNHVALTSTQNANYNNDSIYVVTGNISSYYVFYKVAGCPDTAKLRVDQPVYNAFRPDATVNIFTPNGDSRNDFFFPYYQSTISQYHISKQAETYSLSIYNRWGKLMFETTDYAKGWDGKDQSGNAMDDGTYFYISKYKSNCSTKADLMQKKGFVQLLR